MPDCRAITLASLDEIEWLPPSCAYRLRKEGKSLCEWHPLISNDANSVHKAGISTKDWTMSEKGVDFDDYEDHLIADPFSQNRNKSK